VVDDAGASNRTDQVVVVVALSGEAPRVGDPNGPGGRYRRDLRSLLVAAAQMSDASAPDSVLCVALSSATSAST